MPSKETIPVTECCSRHLKANVYISSTIPKATAHANRSSGKLMTRATNWYSGIDTTRKQRSWPQWTHSVTAQQETEPPISLAVRRLVYEAADTGLLTSELVAGIRRVKGVPQLGRE